MTKKGALELSVNTIVIIVIGVTLLTLGLIFVRQLFADTEDLRGQIFDEAKEELEKLAGETNELLNIKPERVNVKSGEQYDFAVLIKNIEREADVRYTGATLEVVSDKEGVECEVAGSPSVRDLVVGATDLKKVIVTASNGAIGKYTCTVTVVGTDIDEFHDNSNQVVIKVS